MWVQAIHPWLSDKGEIAVRIGLNDSDDQAAAVDGGSQKLFTTDTRYPVARPVQKHQQYGETAGLPTVTHVLSIRFLITVIWFSSKESGYGWTV